MAERLSMPKRLRTNQQVQEMQAAWQQGDSARFAAAYKAYKGNRTTSEDNVTIAVAQGGDEKAMRALWRWFISEAAEDPGTLITDLEANLYLERARAASGGERADICRQLRQHFETRVREYTRTRLFPEQKASETSAVAASTTLIADEDLADGEPETLAALASDNEQTDELTSLRSAVVEVALSTRAREFTLNEAQEDWEQLASSILGSAERVWRDMFLDPNTQPQAQTLSSIARTAQQLMLLWLETTLYQDRSYDNFVATDIESGQAGGDQSTRASIRKRVEEYHATIKQWDDELKKGMRRRGTRNSSAYAYFRSHQLESQQFRRLIGQFSDVDGRELGWTAQATDAKAELRYQLRDELRREYRAGGHPFAAFGMYILKITTGYGTRPAYFFSTVGILFLLDTALFFLNDVFNPGILNSQRFCATSAPHIQTWTNYWDEVMRYAYIAITHLTSLGLNSQLTSYCGGTFSEVVVVFSTVAGYFMLGLLSAMLYTQLTQSD